MLVDYNEKGILFELELTQMRCLLYTLGGRFMRNMFKKVLSIVGILILGYLLFTFINYQVSVHKYNENIEDTISITPQDFKGIKEKSDESIIYFGRASCPYCRSFSEEIKSAINSTGKDIYYIQTDSNEGQDTLKSIREKYNIEYVPTVIKIYKNTDTFETYQPETESFTSFIE